MPINVSMRTSIVVSKALSRVHRLGLVARFTIIGATVGFLVAGGVAWVIDTRLTDFMLAQIAARAMDQVELGVLHSVWESDFVGPYPPDKLADIAARLDPVLTKVREDGSGVIRLHVFAADGTVIYSDLPSKRGKVTPPEKSAGLASALGGSIATGISSLSSPESRELKGRYGSALEVYVPFGIDGHIVGAYEFYQDLAPLQPLRPMVWSGVFGGFALLFLALLTIVRRAAANISRLASILEATPDFVAIADGRGRPIYLNRAARRMLGIGPEDSIGKGGLLDVRPDWARTYLLAEGMPVAGRDGVWSGETALLTHDGSEIPVSEVLLAQTTAAGKVQSYSTIARDISERKEWETALAHQALHDALTDLPNRALLDDRLDQGILAARRDNRPLALLVMDLDRFKDVNDTLGHHHGDLLLQRVGQRVAGVLRSSDTVARLGGDEFAVLLPAVDTVDATLTAEKLLAALEEPFVVEGFSLEARASIGIAVYPEHGDDAQTLLRHADVAMYVAKRSQSGYAVYALEQDEHSPSRLALVGELRRAIEQDELTLYYQPEVDCRSSRVTRVEVLARWEHPTRGLVMPDQFIPLAEQSGLIEPLTRWVLRAALRQCSAWRSAGLDLPVAVNLSMRNLHDPELPGYIAALLQSLDLPARLLRVEITESAVMADANRAMDVLKDLRTLGLQISIDDFGTGYSSLAYLKQLPVDELKIDKSFVLDMTVDENDAAIVRATVELGHQLGLKVLAEGVENKAALDLLRGVGCDMAQGYYFARPLPAPELARWLADADVATTQPRRGAPSLV